MSDRRGFLKRVSLASLSGITFSSLAVPAILPIDSLRKALLETRTDENFWELIRQQFPITQKKTYFNSATMGPSPYFVTERLKQYLEQMESTGNYLGGESAREAICRFVNAGKDEIALTGNTTAGINIVASGLDLNKGDEVIMTSHEHVGNALPWLHQAKKKGFKIKVFTPAMTADENLNLVNDLISPNTKVIAIPHITCTTGVVFPVKSITKLAHEKGVFVFIDGAHGTGSVALDMKEIACDFYASCCHKWLLGPNGTGYLYIKKERLQELYPHHVGAGSESSWLMNEHQQDIQDLVDSAHKFEYGTMNAALYQGVAAAIEFVELIGMEKIVSYIRSLSDHLLKYLLEMEEKIQILSPLERESKAGIVGFRLRDRDNNVFFHRALSESFRIRYVPESSLNSIRISTHLFNNKHDIDRFVDFLLKYAA